MALITKRGLFKLREEQEKLVLEEKKAVEAVVVARSYGDFSENAELEAANGWLERTRKKMYENEQRLAEAEVFDHAYADKTKVNFGAQVTLEDCDSGQVLEYKIVGEHESDISARRISFQSPLARCILGKEVDEECLFRAPGGEKVFIVKKIDYSWLVE